MGLRLPPRRDIARWAHVSEATISRRFRESRSDETKLVSRLLDARRRTHPRGYASEADLLQAALMGVATRQALDPELSHERALAMIQHLAGLLARA